MSYSTFVAPLRRGVILSVLAESADPGCAVTTLREMTRRLGYTVSAEAFDTDLALLAEAELITRREIGGVAFARITERGRDVHLGHLTLPLVERCRE